MCSRAIVVLAALILAPLGAQAADLVVWWDEGDYAQEDEAVREIIAAFEQGSGKRVELVLYSLDELPDKIAAALEIGRPPDFAFGGELGDYIGEWAFDDRLVDLTDTVGSFANLFDPEALAGGWCPTRGPGNGRCMHYRWGARHAPPCVESLLEQAGFTLADIPREWDPFWAFWCDEVQPAVRRSTGRDDVWGVGLSMSGDAADTGTQFDQFKIAYEADYVTRDGRRVIDDPGVHRNLVKAIDSFTAIYRKGCTPPDSVRWDQRR